MKFIIRWHDRQILLQSTNKTAIDNFIKQYYPDMKGIIIATDEAEITKLKDKLKEWQLSGTKALRQFNIATSLLAKAKDKLHRRNMQIKELKARLNPPFTPVFKLKK